MNYLLDSNILIIYLKDPKTREFIEDHYQPFDLPNIPIISVVTVGELKSLALKNNWGPKRISVLNNLLDQVVIADINSEDVIEKYAAIDAFSQGKLKEKPLGMSSRNMGKNDLWIAATASVTNSTLLTIDNDFDHLDGHFIKLKKVKLFK